MYRVILQDTLAPVIYKVSFSINKLLYGSLTLVSDI